MSVVFRNNVNDWQQLFTLYMITTAIFTLTQKHNHASIPPLSLLQMVMEALSREFRVALPRELLYADDLVVIAETEEDLIKWLNKWKDFVENRGTRVNMNKTKVMISGEQQKVMQKAVRNAHVVSVVDVLVIIQYVSSQFKFPSLQQTN